MNLHDFPPELLCLFMKSIDDPRDLYSFLCASAYGLRAFNASKSDILASVIRNSIEPEALAAALAITHVPHLDSQNGRHLQEDFLNKYFEKGYIFDFPENAKDIVSLCGVVWRILFLVEDYATKAWTALHTDTKSSDGNDGDNEDNDDKIPPLVLSRDERAAFQRAFFRFELYCKVFPVYRYRLGEQMTGAQAQQGLFLDRLQLWEIEEMCCAHFYYSRLIAKYAEEVEEYFIESVMACPSRCPLPQNAEEPTYCVYKLSQRKPVDDNSSSSEFESDYDDYSDSVSDDGSVTDSANGGNSNNHDHSNDSTTNDTAPGSEAEDVSVPQIDREAQANPEPQVNPVAERPTKRQRVDGSDEQIATPPKENEDPFEAELERRWNDWRDWVFFRKIDFQLYGMDSFRPTRRKLFGNYWVHLDLMTCWRSAYFYRLIRGDRDTRAKLILGSDLFPSLNGFFSAARSEIPNSTTFPDRSDARGTHAAGPGCGYYLFSRPERSHRELPYAGFGFRCYFPLWERAYMCWDSEKIQQPVVTESLKCAQHTSEEESARLYDGSTRASVQERLDAVGIRTSDMNSFFDKFDGPRFYDDMYTFT